MAYAVDSKSTSTVGSNPTAATSFIYQNYWCSIGVHTSDWSGSEPLSGTINNKTEYLRKEKSMQKKYFQILNQHLQEDKNEFWTKVLNSDGISRIITGFQIYSLKEKMQQYYLTSIGIKLGQALEALFQELLIEQGANFSINRRQAVEGYDCDQIFEFQGKIILIEQKIRDDHDSAKKRGQVENYLHKKDVLNNEYNNVLTCMWFIDPLFSKNKKYYFEELGASEVLYGKEIDDFLMQVFGDNRCQGIWDKVQNILNEYKSEIVKSDITDNINIDYNSLQPKALWQLIEAVIACPELLNVFANFDYSKISKLLKTKRPTEYTKKAISLLEEFINE